MVERFEKNIKEFERSFGGKPKYMFSAPGRVELGGNHTDHQHGRALAAAVELDCRAAASENGTEMIRIFSEGYGMSCVYLNRLEPVAEERETSAALVRGVAEGFRRKGFKLKGFDAWVSSSVQPGGGLSSSAAFEMLLASVINYISDCRLEPTELAKIGRFAENIYFGKPCGLMDQLACASGGVTEMDFANAERPILQKIDFDFSACGYTLCIIDTGASHEGLTYQYSSITEELSAVCRVFSKEYLSDIPENGFYSRISDVRSAAGDRAVLRAIHVYEENKRVQKQAAALRRGDMDGFLQCVRLSGSSSWRLLQNVIPAGNAERQELAFALALAEHLLDGQGACRVHGGGFAGTIQAFVPDDKYDGFKSNIDKALGRESCRALCVRSEGAGLFKVM